MNPNKLKNKNSLKQLLDFLDSLDTQDQRLQFYKAILTPKELEDIPKRLQIVRLLKGGTTHRDIAKFLGVGVATVTRGSRVMNHKVFNQLNK